MKHTCTQESCNYSSDRKSNFSRHLKSHGLDPLEPDFKHFCAVENCLLNFPSFKAYENHLLNAHQIELKKTTIELADANAIEPFLQSIIETEKVFFKKRGTLYWTCNRNSNYQPKTSCTKKKAEEYFGIGKRCPAYISGKKNKNGTITINYCKTHIGHINNIQWMKLPRNQSKILIQDLKDGWDREAIQRKYHRKADELKNIKMTHITTKQLYSLERYHVTNKRKRTEEENCNDKKHKTSC